MIKNFRFVLFLNLFLSIGFKVSAQSVKVVKQQQLLDLINPTNDTTYIVNFWATWCVPCVKELPVFNDAHAFFLNQKVKVILVSLDFKKDLEKRLKPFIEKKKLLPYVYLLDETDYNKWIDMVDTTWSGAIPATLIINRNEKIFLEKELTFNELKSHITKLIH